MNIIGAGFTGCTLARLFAETGAKVTVYEKNRHPGGLCSDSYAGGIWLKQHGPHFFHTNDEDVWNFIQQFGEWEPYTHHVKAKVGEKFYSLPINGITLNELFGACSSVEDIDSYIEDMTSEVDSDNAEDYCLETMGIELYTMFFENYTVKQWGFHPRNLPASIVARVPVRRDFDPRYFLDTFQAIPKRGYTDVMRRMLDHKNIEVLYGTEADRSVSGFWTGRIDTYFQDHLDYRCIWTEYEKKFLPAATVNYPGLETYTRETRIGGNWVIREFPGWVGEPAYPVHTEPNVLKYKELEAKAAETSKVVFAGRLGKFKYLNMDQAIREAIDLFKEITE